MGIKLVENGTKYVKHQHHLAEDIQISVGDVVVVSIKPPSTDYCFGDKTDYNGDTCIAVCSSDESGGSIEHAAEHIAYLNSFPLQRSEVGYTHSCMGMNLDYDIRKMVQAILPEKEEKHNKIQEELETNRKNLAEQQEIARQTRLLHEKLESYAREDYTNAGWERLTKSLCSNYYPKAILPTD